MAALQKILVAVEDFQGSDVALAHASALGKESGAEIVLLRVVLPSLNTRPAEELRDQARRDLQRAMTKVEGHVRAAVQEADDVAQGILEAAVTESPDFVFIPRRSEPEFASFSQSGDNEAALRKLPVPIAWVAVPVTEIQDDYGDAAQTGPGEAGGMGTAAAPSDLANNSSTAT